MKPTTSTQTLCKRVENSWMLVAKESLLKNNNFSIITLPNPVKGDLRKYCLDESHKKIYEVVSYKESHRSWFLDDTVKSDGSLVMLTSVNPIFLVLPRVREQCNDRAIPLDDLLSEKGFDMIIDYLPDLEMIADQKGLPEMKAYKYNHLKTLNWLEERVHKVIKVLRQKNIHVKSGAVSATFVTSDISNNDTNEEFYLRYAHGLISEYLQDDLMEALREHLNLQPELIETLTKKRKSDSIKTNDSKKVKLEDQDCDKKENLLSNLNESFSFQNKKVAPLSTKEKARLKAASGTKSISSFFKKAS